MALGKTPAPYGVQQPYRQSDLQPVTKIPEQTNINPVPGTVTAVTGTPPIASSGGPTPDISLDNSGVSAGSYGDSTHVGTFTVDAHGLITAAANVAITGFTPNAITALTGDGTATGPGSVPLTLATVNSNVGTWGDATHVGAVTVNAKGLVTAASNVLIAGTEPGGAAGGDLSGTYPNPTVIKNSIAVAQTTHGFSVGMPITKGTSAWAQSDNSSLTLACDAIVSSIVDANNFVAQTVGTLTLTTGQWDARTGESGGLTVGEYYWLGGAGLLTKTMPTTGYDQVLFKAQSTTAAVLEIGDSFSSTFYNADVADKRILANISGGTAPALPNTLSAILANILGNGIAGQAIIGDGAGNFSLGYGIPRGASNPGSPSTNDVFYRTDLHWFIYYDGSQWLTMQEFNFDTGDGTTASFPFAATGYSYTSAVRQDYGIYMTKLVATTFVAATNNGSNFWTVDLLRCTAANVETTVASFNTSADTQANWVNHDTTINAALNSSARVLRLKLTKTSTPGTAYLAAQIFFRLIVT